MIPRKVTNIFLSFFYAQKKAIAKKKKKKNEGKKIGDQTEKRRR
jgi:hypothetical protein